MTPLNRLLLTFVLLLGLGWGGLRFFRDLTLLHDQLQYRASAKLAEIERDMWQAKYENLAKRCKGR